MCSYLKFLYILKNNYFFADFSSLRNLALTFLYAIRLFALGLDLKFLHSFMFWNRSSDNEALHQGTFGGLVVCAYVKSPWSSR